MPFRYITKPFLCSGFYVYALLLLPRAAAIDHAMDRVERTVSGIVQDLRSDADKFIVRIPRFMLGRHSYLFSPVCLCVATVCHAASA